MVNLDIKVQVGGQSNAFLTVPPASPSTGKKAGWIP